MSGTPRAFRLVLSGLLALVLVAAPAQGRGLLEENHPAVARGQAAYDKGDYEGALKAFDEAKAALPRSPAVEFDRGNALYKLGRHEEAQEAFARVLAAGDSSLEARTLYNLGNAFASADMKKEAIASYRKALRLNPTDEDTRANLEFLLRSEPPPPPSGPDGGTDGGADGGAPDSGQSDAGQPDGGRDGGSDGGSDGGADGGGGDGGHADGGRGDGGSPQQQPGDGGSDGGSDGGADADSARPVTSDGGMSVEEAKKLLDSLKQNEKNLQLWRFQERPRTKKPHGKDW